jgi:hypothetical protein
MANVIHVIIDAQRIICIGNVREHGKALVRKGKALGELKSHLHKVVAIGTTTTLTSVTGLAIPSGVSIVVGV